MDGILITALLSTYLVMMARRLKHIKSLTGNSSPKAILED